MMDLLRDVFGPEYNRFVAWLRRHRLPFSAFIVALGCVFLYSILYSRWPGPVRGIGSALRSRPNPLWISLVFLLWLLVLTYLVYPVGKSRMVVAAGPDTTEQIDREVEEGKPIELSGPRVRLPDYLGGVELLLIPAGEFSMGGWAEQPVHLDTFYIAKYPITNAQYKRFTDATAQQSPSYWSGRDIPESKENHPVVHVRWYDGRAYCDWLSRETGHVFRLPTEAEWEKAAQGTERGAYPWGDEWDHSRCNSHGYLGDTTPVDEHCPAGDSRYGVADMAGNVWEWTNSLKKDLPYNPDDGREDPKGHGERILRGGSFKDSEQQVQCGYRYVHNRPEAKGEEIGFRIAVSRGS